MAETAQLQLFVKVQSGWVARGRVSMVPDPFYGGQSGGKGSVSRPHRGKGAGDASCCPWSLEKPLSRWAGRDKQGPGSRPRWSLGLCG